jgi:plasmid maintenance system antidote protein VapI
MENSSNNQYSHAIIARVRGILEMAGLEILGLSVLTGLSESHVYSLLSGRRSLTEDVALVIGESLNFDGRIIFNLNIDIPESIKKSINLKKFRLRFKDNKEYFIDTKIERKPSHFVEHEVVGSDFLNEPKYVWEINEYCSKHGKDYTSDKLKKYLGYFAKTGKLNSKKASIKLRNGAFGNRMVDVFWNK